MISDDRYNPPEMSSSIAMKIAEECNSILKVDYPFSEPVNLAMVFNVIGKYTRNNEFYREGEVTFSMLYMNELVLNKPKYALLENPKPGLIEYRILNTGYYSIVFPRYVNCGWQTETYKKYIEERTVFHGYVSSKEEAIKMFEHIQKGNIANEIVTNIEQKDFSRETAKELRNQLKKMDGPISDRVELYMFLTNKLGLFRSQAKMFL